MWSGAALPPRRSRKLKAPASQNRTGRLFQYTRLYEFEIQTIFTDSDDMHNKLRIPVLNRCSKETCVSFKSPLTGQGCLHHHESLGWRAALVREPDHQRDSGRLQQPHPIRQGQGSGVAARTRTLPTWSTSSWVNWISGYPLRMTRNLHLQTCRTQRMKQPVLILSVSS